MKSFKDNAGRTWEVAINVASVKRMRDMLNVDLMSILDEKSDLLMKLATDPVLMVDLVYVVCKPQADTAGVTDAQFGEAMGGDSLDGAYQALTEAIADFFRGPQRTLLGKALAKMSELESKAVAHGVAQLDAATLPAQPEPTPGVSSTSAPESSG